MSYGILGFLLTFIVTVVSQGFKKEEMVLKKLWAVAIPCFIALFVLTVVLSGNRGAPDTGNLAIFALREKYRFTRGEEVERWRFVTVATSFLICWHGFAMVFVIDQWARFRARLTNIG
jgi:hypothetical protein